MNALAHQGGWDEILMVAGPLLVFAGVLYLANRRANAKLAEAAQSAGDAEVDGSEAAAASEEAELR